MRAMIGSRQSVIHAICQDTGRGIVRLSRSSSSSRAEARVSRREAEAVASISRAEVVVHRAVDSRVSTEEAVVVDRGRRV